MNYGVCYNIVNKIFDLAEISFEHQQNHDSANIDQFFWKDQINLFIEGLENIAPIQMRTTNVVPNLRNQETLYEQSKLFISEKELHDYINGKGQWTPQHHEEKDENDAVVIPKAPKNNTLLGNLVIKILEQSYPEDIKAILSKFSTHPDLLAIK